MTRRWQAAAEAAREAASVLQDRESALSQLTEDIARLAARHQSAQRLLQDTQRRWTGPRATRPGARCAGRFADRAERGRCGAGGGADGPDDRRYARRTRPKACWPLADEARAETQAREADARAERSEAEGEANALRAEVAALARLVERDTAEGGQVLDLLRVTSGYEKALGAALADDLRAPAVGDDGPVGLGRCCRPTRSRSPCPRACRR